MRYLRVAGTDLHHIRDEESEEKSGYEAICGQILRRDMVELVFYPESRTQPVVCVACQRERERWQDGDVGQTSG